MTGKTELDSGRFIQVPKDSAEARHQRLDSPDNGLSPLADEAQDSRHPDHDILPLFCSRWSPRAMTAEKLPESQLLRLFEAARWAPSTYNEQEWRYLYAHRASKHWDLFFEALTEANQSWCKNASVLVAIVGKEQLTQSGEINPVRSFDCGASFQNLALQGISMNLVVHGMAGFSKEKIIENLDIPGGYSPEAMFAIGYPARAEVLPDQLRKGEHPSDRKKVEDFICEGPFRFKDHLQ